MKKKIVKDDDCCLLPLIREIVDQRATYEYRRVTILLRNKIGEKINYKRVSRIMKQNGLLLQRHTGRPVRSHDGKRT